MLLNAEGRQITDVYFWGPFLKDTAIGAAAIVMVVAVAMRLGGFSFILPWAIVAPPVLFLAGWLRGLAQGNIWIKGVSISMVALILLVGSTDGLSLFLGTFWIVLPVVGGIWLRRNRRGHRSTEGKAVTG